VCGFFRSMVEKCCYNGLKCSWDCNWVSSVAEVRRGGYVRPGPGFRGPSWRDTGKINDQYWLDMHFESFTDWFPGGEVCYTEFEPVWS
jgi:hypothetical protein